MGGGGNSVIREQLEEPSELQWTGLGMGHWGIKITDSLWRARKTLSGTLRSDVI